MGIRFIVTCLATMAYGSFHYSPPQICLGPLRPGNCGRTWARCQFHKFKGQAEAMLWVTLAPSSQPLFESPGREGRTMGYCSHVNLELYFHFTDEEVEVPGVRS